MKFSIVANYRKSPICSIFLIIIGLFTVVIAVQEALAGNSRTGLYAYFIQPKNITNLNTQFPAKEGLLDYNDTSGIKSIGSHSKRTKRPSNFLQIYTNIIWKKKTLSFSYCLESRYLDDKYTYGESLPQTHVYIITPKNVFPVLEHQKAYVSGDTRSVDMVSAEKADIVNVLKVYNSILDGNKDQQDGYSNEMERAFDGTLDLLGPKGKFAKFIKKYIKIGIENAEEKRIASLKEKYGEKYQIYRLPFHVLKKISFKGVNLGRKSHITFYSSYSSGNVTNKTKIFIDIPKITFEANVQGATRKASLSGLVYEVIIEPEYFATGIASAKKKQPIQAKKKLKKYKEPPPRPSASIYQAVEWGNDEIVHSHYYYKTANLDGEKKNVPLIFIALNKGHLHIVEQLLSYGVSPDSICKRAHIAVGNLEKYNFSFQYAGSCFSDISLMDLAIHKNSNEMVKLLLEYNASPKSSMKRAVEKGNVGMVKLLLEHHANPEAYLKHAVKRGNVEIAKLLIDNGAHVGPKEFASAVSKRDYDLVTLLLNSGIDVQKIGETIITAIESDDHKMIEILLDAGVDSSGELRNLFDYDNDKRGIDYLDIKRFSLNGSFKVHKMYGRIFILKGQLENNQNIPHRASLIIAEVAGKNIMERIRKKVYAGNSIADEKLLSMSKSDINAILSNKNSLIEEVNPGESIPFMSVFFDIPFKPDRFQIRRAWKYYK